MSMILIVDDMAVVREPIAATLRAYGYRTLCAASGEEALAAMQISRPDLVLLDLAMPGMDGMAVLRILRGQDRTIPVIFLTASCDTAHVVEAARLGVRDYLTKSAFSLTELLPRVRKYLSPPGPAGIPCTSGSPVRAIAAKSVAMTPVEPKTPKPGPQLSGGALDGDDLKP